MWCLIFIFNLDIETNNKAQTDVHLAIIIYNYIGYNHLSVYSGKMGNSHVNGNIESKKVRVGGQTGRSRPGERSGSDTGSSEQVIPTVDRPVVSEDHKEIISRTWRILQEDIARVGVCIFIGWVLEAVSYFFKVTIDISWRPRGSMGMSKKSKVTWQPCWKMGLI